MGQTSSTVDGGPHAGAPPLTPPPPPPSLRAPLESPPRAANTGGFITPPHTVSPDSAETPTPNRLRHGLELLSDGLYPWQRARFDLSPAAYNDVLRKRRAELLALDLTTAPPLVMDEWLLLIVEMNRVLHTRAPDPDEALSPDMLRRRDSAPERLPHGHGHAADSPAPPSTGSPTKKLGVVKRIESWTDARRSKQREAKATFHPGPEYKARMAAAAAKLDASHPPSGRPRSRSMNAMSWGEARDLVFGMQASSFAFEPLPPPQPYTHGAGGGDGGAPQGFATLHRTASRDSAGLSDIEMQMPQPRYGSVLSPPQTISKSPQYRRAGQHRPRRSKMQKSLFSASGQKLVRLPKTSFPADDVTH
eukprot:m.239152 g.239152  ORF g.239152 m.239152 type:complete len:362 (-) comp26252_c0_seq2:118-1203(-)